MPKEKIAKDSAKNTKQAAEKKQKNKKNTVKPSKKERRQQDIDMLDIVGRFKETLKLMDNADKKEQAKKANKEQLKAEARAYVINAIIAYGEAFDIEEMKDMDEEDIKELETLIKKIEEVYPTYLQLWKKQKEFEDGFKFGFGLGGF